MNRFGRTQFLPSSANSDFLKQGWATVALSNVRILVLWVMQDSTRLAENCFFYFSSPCELCMLNCLVFCRFVEQQCWRIDNLCFQFLSKQMSTCCLPSKMSVPCKSVNQGINLSRRREKVIWIWWFLSGPSSLLVKCRSTNIEQAIMYYSICLSSAGALGCWKRL